MLSYGIWYRNPCIKLIMEIKSSITYSIYTSTKFPSLNSWKSKYQLESREKNVRKPQQVKDNFGSCADTLVEMSTYHACWTYILFSLALCWGLFLCLATLHACIGFAFGPRFEIGVESASLSQHKLWLRLAVLSQKLHTKALTCKWEIELLNTITSKQRGWALKYNKRGKI